MNYPAPSDTLMKLLDDQQHFREAFDEVSIAYRCLCCLVVLGKPHGGGCPDQNTAVPRPRLVCMENCR